MCGAGKSMFLQHLRSLGPQSSQSHVNCIMYRGQKQKVKFLLKYLNTNTNLYTFTNPHIQAVTLVLLIFEI